MGRWCLSTITNIWQWCSTYKNHWVNIKSSFFTTAKKKDQHHYEKHSYQRWSSFFISLISTLLAITNIYKRNFCLLMMAIRTDFSSQSFSILLFIELVVWSLENFTRLLILWLFASIIDMLTHGGLVNKTYRELYSKWKYINKLRFIIKKTVRTHQKDADFRCRNV